MKSLLKAGIVVAAVALGGCDQIRDLTGMPDDSAANTANTSVAVNTTTAVGDKPAATAAPADPALAGQIATAAVELNRRTPMTVDPITTLVGVRSQGTEIVYEMRVSQDIPSAQLATIQQTAQTGNQTNLCGDPNAGRLIRMGASMSHYYTDPTGDRFETHVTSCPG